MKRMFIFMFSLFAMLIAGTVVFADNATEKASYEISVDESFDGHDIDVVNIITNDYADLTESNLLSDTDNGSGINRPTLTNDLTELSGNKHINDVRHSIFSFSFIPAHIMFNSDRDLYLRSLSRIKRHSKGNLT